MPKRPSLSTNLRLLPGERPDETKTGGIAIAPELRAIEGDAFAWTSSPPKQPDPTTAIKAEDDPIRIIGDTLRALSLASAIGWTQGLSLHYRLSSYMMNVQRNPFRTL